jgi:hypothetical protein
MRTDEQIVMETNELARLLLADIIGTGYEAPEGHKFWEATDPRSEKAWAAAVKAMELITKTEVEDALNNYRAELEVKPQRYKTPHGELIIGTAEIVPACNRINGINPDGTPNYDGQGTDLYWDDQVTQSINGMTIYLCESGQRWVFNQLTPIEDDADDE